MIFLEAYQIAILMALFVNAALSDLHRGIVSNKSILFALAAGIVSVIPYYAFFATDCLTAYAINLVIGIGTTACSSSLSFSPSRSFLFSSS